MKKINSLLNSLILNMAIIFTTYGIGFIITFVLALVSLIFYAVGSGKECNDIVGIIGFAVQCLAVSGATIILGIFSDLKIKDILLSIPITAIILLLIERFCFTAHAINIPWSMTILPRIYKYMAISRGDTVYVYIERHLYLLSTVLITTVNTVIIIFSYALIRLKRRHKSR